MEQPANASDENHRLRRTVRDLVALSTLPAVWIGLGPDRIASSLADVLLDALSLDLIYVRLAALNGDGVVEFVRRKNRSDALAVDVARAAFAPLLTTDQTESSALISDPFDGGPLHVTVIRFGGNDDQGVLVCGSCKPDFPTERDRALLGVGANQVAMVLQRRRAEKQAQEEREWLRVTLASIGDAVIAADTQGRVTYLNAVAEELTGWTNNHAEGEPLETVFPILNENTRLPVENPVEQVLREGVVIGLANHTILIAKDGTERPIDDSAAPIRDAAGKMLGVVLIFREVTEQRRAERELRGSEARKSAILETALDSIISMDHEGKVCDFNSAAERTFGYSRGDAIGRELADLIIPPSLRERHQQGMARYLATGEGPVLGKRLELSALHADGSEFPVELTITRILTDGPPLFTAYLRDISERTRAEQYRNARLGVTQVLNQASDVREGASGVLRAVCESLAWDVGFFWIVNKDGDGIECLESWHKPELPVTEFEAASFGRAFKKGEGLPGHVWSTGTPCWLPDVERDANFPRAASAAKYDLRSAFACPVVVGDRMLGVIEFFTRRIREPDADLLEMMGTLAGNVGQFIERRSAEQELRESEQRFTGFMQHLPGLAWIKDVQGRYVYANNAAVTAFRTARAELYGRTDKEVFPPETAAQFQRNDKQAMSSGTGVQVVEVLQQENGVRHSLVSKFPILGSDGQVALVGGMAIDITEQRRVEQTLRHSEERFRSLMDQAPFSIQVFSPDGRTSRVNRAWEELWGVTLDQIDGYNIFEDQQLEAKGLLPMIKQAFAGEPTFIPAIQYDPNETIPGQTRHDDPVRWVAAVAYPLKDDAGTIREVVLVHDDITARRNAEAALRESEEKLRLLADTIPQLAWMARPDGHIFWYNSRWYEYTGTTPEQMEGWGWQSVHDPDVLPKVLERWKRSITNGEPFDMVFPLKGADGQFRPFLTRVNPLTSEGGQILYWFGTNTDIAELREAREALAVSEERLRLALDAGHMGVWDWNIRTGELKWSDSLEPLHGLAPGTFGGTFDHFQQLIHPEDRETVNIAIGQALEAGGEFYVEFRNARPNGGIHWIAGSGKVFPGDDGQPLRMIGIGLDVTQRKRAELRSRFLADASAALAVLVDFDSTLQRVSSLAVPSFADWATVDVADADGSLRRVSVSHSDPTKVQLTHEVHRRFPPDPAAPQGVWNILRTGRSEIVPEITDELLVQSVHDAELLDIIRELGLKSYIGVPLTVRGKTLGVITFINAESGYRYDNTDLAVAEDLASRAAIAIENAQLYQELREADRRKDEFLATLAHELRNPLAPVRNALEILKMPRVDSQTVERSRQMMERQVQHLVRLVDDLLDVSRVMRGKIQLRREKVELATIVARAVETVQPLVDAQRHQLKVHMSPDSLLLDADPVRLAQVVGNLLTNAVKYAEPNGRIWLTGEREGDMAVLRVRDNGIGIAPHMLPRIFELFVQVDHASTKAQGGLGIGLTLVKNLVEMHNGIVQCRSDGLGHGSEFVVRLPLVEQTADQDHGSDTARQASQYPPPSGKRVLVVDDNQDAADSLAMLLKLQRHEVRVAYSGMAALEIIKTYTPDVVLLDIGMPGIDGYEVARRLRQTPGLGNVVLAALTGWGQQEDRRRTVEAGFDHHLVKPPEPEVLEKLLAK